MDRDVIKISEIFHRAAQMPISVVMAEDTSKHGKGVRNYYTRLHVCPEDIVTNKADNNERCHEFQGHYDMTWDEAVKSFYTRQLQESQGTDQAKFAPQMVCSELKAELQAYKDLVDTENSTGKEARYGD